VTQKKKASPQLTAPKTDIDAITQTILDYMIGGPEKRARALHPALAKRAFVTHPDTHNTVLRIVTPSELVETVRCGPDPQPNREWRTDITIFDVYEDVAVARAIGQSYMDYIHLAKVDGEWTIINILCRPPRRPQSRARATFVAV
jgi:hypothetical protein